MDRNQKKAMFAKLQIRKGLNSLTVKELKHSNGKYYDPPLFQVNVNGKGIETPSNLALTKQHLKHYASSVKYYNKIGKKINQ